MSTYERIERSRESRLWISQVIIPVVTVGAIIVSKIPKEDIEKVKEKAKEITKKVFHK